MINCNKSVLKNLLLVLCLFPMGIFSFTACGGSAPAPEPVETMPIEPEPSYLEHTVKYSGESLSLVAMWYTGKSSNWNLIAQANPNLRPERIGLGQLILVPQELVVESKPLPESFVRQVLGKVQKKPAEPESESLDNNNLDQTNTPAAAEPNTVNPVTEEILEVEEAEITPPVTAPTNSQAPSNGQGMDDKERERLLDELLSQ